MRTRHPCGLYLLALVQTCERFAFFATLPLFVLYLQQRCGLSSDGALLLFGSLQAASYLSGLPGGYAADQFLGHRLATGLGGVLLTLGYAALALDIPSLLWPALGLLVVGHGFFKTSLHALAGSIYADGDPMRDRGFLLMHIFFNAGSAIGPLVAEWARARWGWAAIFQVATLAMLGSMTSFALGAWAISSSLRAQNKAGAAVLSAAAQRERSRACWLVCAIGVVFWLLTMQSGTSLALFAAENTQLAIRVLGRALPVAPGYFMALHSLLVLVIAPPLGWLMAYLGRRNQEPSLPGKLAWGLVAAAAAFAVMGLAGLQGGDSGRVSAEWLGSCYVLLTIAEVLLSPMSLALITRLSPPSRMSQMIGLWFTSTAVGSWLAGAVGLLWHRWPHHRYFVLLALLALGAAALLLTQLGRLERLLTAERATQAP